ncbi:MAG: pseudaminic acid cytidylyltransferase [Bacteroidales bacterium]
MPNNLAIIPARGGSKRIPGKNIKPFLGKPIIAYSIEAAINSQLFNEVMVSTDDPKIAKIAKEYGAKVPFLRSTENADDHATLADAIREVIDEYKNINRNFDYTCCILPTCPLLTKENLEEAYNVFLKGQFDSLRPIVRFSYPIQRALAYKKGKVEMMHPEHARTRSQDLEPAYHDSGQFYWFIFDRGLTGKNKGGIIIPESRVQDIDTEEDWILAEIKYAYLNAPK